MFEEYRTAQSAAGPEIDRLRRREEELLREVRRQNNERAKLQTLLFRTVPSYLPRDHVVQDMRSRMNRQEAKIESQKARLKVTKQI